MSFQPLTTGTGPNTHSGDSIRAAYIKVNSNFEELYTATNALAGISTVEGLLKVSSGTYSAAVNGVDYLAPGNAFGTAFADDFFTVTTYGPYYLTHTPSGQFVNLYLDGILQRKNEYTVSISTTTTSTVTLNTGTIGSISTYTDLEVVYAVQNTATFGYGSVYSVNVSGGSTGLTTYGGPITSFGTIYLDGVLNNTSGGAGNVTGILKANGAGVVSSATSGVDYLAPGNAFGATFNEDSYSVSGPGPYYLTQTPTGQFVTYYLDGVLQRRNDLILTINTGSSSTVYINTASLTTTSIYNSLDVVYAVQNTASFGYGSVFSVNVSGGTTGLTTTGGPVTTGGTVYLGGVLNSTSGGAGSVNGLMKANGTGQVTTATAGVDYNAAIVEVLDEFTISSSTTAYSLSHIPVGIAKAFCDGILQPKADSVVTGTTITISTALATTYSYLQVNYWRAGP